uniref:Transmembrane protein n=1 Tax=Trypanosoma vivax (strain Y486) TaxID=1055687 RepID=G0U5Z0_TRYVY|nr:hypothetical protein TVY486_1003440 [Trypanosoma vivax Y486]
MEAQFRPHDRKVNMWDRVFCVCVCLCLSIPGGMCTRVCAGGRATAEAVQGVIVLFAIGLSACEKGIVWCWVRKTIRGSLETRIRNKAVWASCLLLSSNLYFLHSLPQVRACQTLVSHIPTAVVLRCSPAVGIVIFFEGRSVLFTPTYFCLGFSLSFFLPIYFFLYTGIQTRVIFSCCRPAHW